MNEHLKGLPESVLRMIQQAEAQRHAYSAHPDPLPIAEPQAEGPALELTPDELLAECAGEPETDIGNARRLITRFGEQIRYVQNVGWHAFDGTRWKEDTGDVLVRRKAQLTAEFIDDEAILLDCSDEEKATIEQGRLAQATIKTLGKRDQKWDADTTAKFDEAEQAIEKMRRVNKDRDGRMSSRHAHAKSAAGTTKINNMLTETAPHVSLEVDELNRDLMAVNCLSGTLRFVVADGKYQVREDRHRPGDLISKRIEATFKASASCYGFENFFQEVMPDVDLRRFLQRYAGYCLLGLTGEQCLVFFYGAGRNGKSTFVDILCEILGDYAVAMSIDSFAGDSRRGGAEATPDLARLPGARMVAASEPEMGVHLKDALIKTLTGGEPIAVRRLHKDFFELIPQFKIILSGNHKPVIKDDSDGIWRRVHLVPWEVQIPEERVDKSLKQKLLAAERDGIFAWLVRGALDYLESGLNVPESVRLATSEYREENDPIGAFLRNGCHITGKDEDREGPKELFDAYLRFASREGLPEFKQATFTKRLPDQTRKTFKGPDGMQHSFRKGKSGTTVYFGISIKDEYGPVDDRNPPSYRAPDEDFPEPYP